MEICTSWLELVISFVFSLYKTFNCDGIELSLLVILSLFYYAPSSPFIIIEDVESGVVDSLLTGSEFNANLGIISQDYYRIQREECLSDLFKREIQHLPCGDYLNRLRIGEVDFKARKQIIDWITEVNCFQNASSIRNY